MIYLGPRLHCRESPFDLLIRYKKGSQYPCKRVNFASPFTLYPISFCSLKKDIGTSYSISYFSLGVNKKISANQYQQVT